MSQITKEKLSIEDEIKTVAAIFGRNLRLLRISEDLGAEELSQRIGIPVKRIYKLEEGVQLPTFKELIKIVDFFPITFNDILDRKLQLHIPSLSMNKYEEKD